MLTAKPLEIVVVDDEEQITELLKMAIQFTSKTANVHTFTDATRARDYLLHNEVDVVITDYKMPACDGIELLRAAPARVRKVLISGYVTEIAEERLAELNAVFFEKPVPIKSLGRIILEEELRLSRRPVAG